MRKTKIAMFFRDSEYQTRFVKCWMHHFEPKYEVHVFTSLAEIARWEEEAIVVLLEGVSQEEIEMTAKEKQIVLCLLENQDILNMTQGNVMLTLKYQEVYRIEQILRERIQREGSLPIGKNNWERTEKLIGVFSLDLELFQVPFCAMIASEYGEKTETILLNLQMASGLEEREENEKCLCMEDLLVAATTMQYSKSRILDGIVREQNWDYVIPVENMMHLVETDNRVYQNLIQILTQEMGYETVILNFGIVFSGMSDLMYQCDEVYLLVPQKSRVTRREKAFLLEMQRIGNEELLQKLVRIEIPFMYGIYESWRKLAQQWRWDNVGDQIRRGV